MAGNPNDDIAKALANLSHERPDTSEHDHAEPVKSYRQRPAEPTPDPVPQTPFVPSPSAVAAGAGRLEAKRTLIPILLVTGGILILGAAMCLLLGEESPIEGAILPILMLGLGVLILGAAAATMFQVKQSLSGEAKR